MCTGGNLVVEFFFLHITIIVWVTYHLLIVTNTLLNDNEFTTVIISVL